MPSIKKAKATAKPSKKVGPKQRRGPKGYFQGTRKDFLEAQLPTYIASKGNRRKFWHDFYCAWWLRYPWKLEDNQEPPTDKASEMSQLASVGPGEKKKKEGVEKLLSDRLSSWLSNRAASRDDVHRDTDAWLPLLQQLHQIRNPRPRCRTAAQQFMVDNPDVIKAAFVSLYAKGVGYDNAQRMNLRSEISRKLVAGQSPDAFNELERRAKDFHERELDQWKLSLDNISEAEDVSLARDTFFDAVHPLLRAIGTYAGCYVSLIVGNPAKDELDDGFFTAVHWWPGDHNNSQSWTAWDPEGFNSGVAGPFLTYATEADDMLRVPVPPTPANASTAPELAQSTGPTVARSESVHTGGSSANYRPRPPQNKPPIVVPTTTKRKHTSKSKSSRPIHYFEDSSSEEIDASQQSGDGSSSGDSLAADAPTSAKRQRTSRVTTRSLAVTSAPDLVTKEASNPPSLAPALPVLPLAVTAVAAATMLATPPASLSTDPTTVAASADIHLASTPSNDMDNEFSPADSPHTKDSPHAESEATAVASTEVAVIDTNNTAAGTTVAVTGADTPKVPDFLLHHGKGTRTVDIFAYLNKINDPHFRQLLFHYIQFEANEKSGATGSLPTKKRPLEISQWTSRARPASLPDFHKGKRTFQMFVDSVFVWWGSIQPAWRIFDRNCVSREVCGGWDALHSPRTNGLLNVVILAYWWIQVLNEHGPEGSVRADYEFFVEDVTWVFSRL